MISASLRSLRSVVQTHRDLALENLALRQQLAVLQRSVTRPQLTPRDRWFWVLLRRLWTEWDQVLLIVKPNTVVAWHRAGFRCYWTWKSRRRRPGRPGVSREVRDLIRTISTANPLWGAPRVHGELLKLGISVAQATVSKYLTRPRTPPSQTWRTFLDNHVPDLVSVDFFTVPTATFRVLFVFVVLSHDRRRIVHVNVTAHPTATWTAQQVVDAFPWDTAPLYLLRDRDAIYDAVFAARVEALGIRQVLTAPRSPWQNPYVERVIGSLRRECLNHVIVLNQRHLQRILHEYVDYYHACRTHASLDKDTPDQRQVEAPHMGRVTAIPKVGGLHHLHTRRAA
jgi:putative transposase